MKVLFQSLVSLFLLISTEGFGATENSSVSVEDRIHALEETVEKLDVQVGLLKERTKILAGRTLISYLNTTYLQTEFHLLFPRGPTFTYPTDTGLGVCVGLGHYFLRNHAAEFNLDWNLYPAANALYRYEWRNRKNTINLGPIVGLKLKLGSQKPLDKYLDPREDLKSVYGIVGLGVGLPVGFSILQTQLLAFFNQHL
ncbi:MAG: hypothetical protein ACKN9V_09195, partial [Pseudomonadota bacterium]